MCSVEDAGEQQGDGGCDLMAEVMNTFEGEGVQPVHRAQLAPLVPLHQLFQTPAGPHNAVGPHAPLWQVEGGRQAGPCKGYTMLLDIMHPSGKERCGGQRKVNNANGFHATLWRRGGREWEGGEWQPGAGLGAGTLKEDSPQAYTMLMGPCSL